MQLAVFLFSLSIIVFSFMSLWYLVALYSNRYDVVDSAWGLGFILVAWVSLLLRSNFGTVQIISATLVTLWGLRLFAHIAQRNWRKSEDDHRYQAMRAKWGKSERQKAYINVFLLQGLLFTIISTPLIAIAFSHRLPNIVTYVGWTIWLLGIAFEAIADRQLALFIARRSPGSHVIMDKGLWKYSRHPNYFGEVVTWWGAALVALGTGNLWGIIGAAVITLLITRVSGIPPLEKHYDGNPAYETYRKHTPVLVPRLPKL
jgi:steroid 5-alpha reductase family enzyme